jgi:hypothetical protein
VGWVFVPRLPVRGAVSRSAVKQSRRKRDEATAGRPLRQLVRREQAEVIGHDDEPAAGKLAAGMVVFEILVDLAGVGEAETFEEVISVDALCCEPGERESHGLLSPQSAQSVGCARPLSIR